jgi:hypothetical protein
LWHHVMDTFSTPSFIKSKISPHAVSSPPSTTLQPTSFWSCGLDGPNSLSSKKVAFLTWPWVQS